MPCCRARATSAAEPYVRYIPSVKKEADPHPRIPAPDAEFQRPPGAFPSPGKRSPAANCVIRISVPLPKLRSLGRTTPAGHVPSSDMPLNKRNLGSGTLGRGADLGLLLRRGWRSSSRLFYVTSRPNGLAHSRFAFIVPRAVDKRAVVRNRLRRRMREYIRARAGRIAPSHDIAITCKKEAAKAPRVHFYAELEEFLKRFSPR